MLNSQNMKLKLTFKENEIIPPSQFLAYVSEASPKIEPNGKRRRRVVVKDIRNNEIFEADFDSIRAGNTTNSPSMKRKQFLKNAHNQKATQKNAESRRKYHIGDIIGPDNNILVLDDFSPVITTSGEIKKKRRGIFKNLDTNIIFESTFNNVLCGFTWGMPLKEKSKGEYKIQSLLIEHNINFIREYIFDELKDSIQVALRFDFYLPDYNCCIEYDGLQHFENHFGVPKDKYQHQLNNDNIKNDFCLAYNISLIRIPYYDYNKIDWEYLWAKIQQ